MKFVDTRFVENSAHVMLVNPVPPAKLVFTQILYPVTPSSGGFGSHANWLGCAAKRDPTPMAARHRSRILNHLSKRTLIKVHHTSDLKACKLLFYGKWTMVGVCLSVSPKLGLVGEGTRVIDEPNSVRPPGPSSNSRDECSWYHACSIHVLDSGLICHALVFLGACLGMYEIHFLARDTKPHNPIIPVLSHFPRCDPRANDPSTVAYLRMCHDVSQVSRSAKNSDTLSLLYQLVIFLLMCLVCLMCQGLKIIHSLFTIDHPTIQGIK